MTIHHFLRLSFVAIFVITALICIYFIIKKHRNKKGPKLLTEEKYSSTMLGKMTEITVFDNIFNIWPYVSKLKSAKVLSHKIKESQLVHKVYRNSTEDFEHILLPTEKENHFIIIVADRHKKKTIGYFLHDLNGLYA
ncbi:hypothetical protein OA88_12855 [Flavobacterium sp. JRM]|nr:hypothetical protein OA88_12855 [Flavobacterium sp. JRM]